MRIFTLAVTILGCLFLSSCFEVREEIWIEKDGSGRAELNYTIPSTAVDLAGGEQGLRQEVEAFIDAVAGLQLDEFKVTSTGGDSIVFLKASTNSVLSLIDTQNSEALMKLPEKASGFAGVFDVKLDGLVVDFDRRIDLKNSLGFASLAISNAQRQQRQLHYIIHLPAEAGTHNATNVTDGGRTLIWKQSLGEALTSPINTSFRLRIPIPWWIYLGAVLVVALLLWVLIKIRRRKKRARQPSS